MNATILREYTRERREGFHMTLQGQLRPYRSTAASAFRAAKTRFEFQQKECGKYDEPEMGNVRLRIVPDDCVDFADLEGDSFDPEVNNDVPRARLEREQKEFRARVNRDGVCGIIGEYYDGEKWQHGDSCFGFVGDDWRSSGYDIDIMQTTLDAAESIETCPTCNRPMVKK